MKKFTLGTIKSNIHEINLFIAELLKEYPKVAITFQDKLISIAKKWRGYDFPKEFFDIYHSSSLTKIEKAFQSLFNDIEDIVHSMPHLNNLLHFLQHESPESNTDYSKLYQEVIELGKKETEINNKLESAAYSFVTTENLKELHTRKENAKYEYDEKRKILFKLYDEISESGRERYLDVKKSYYQIHIDMLRMAFIIKSEKYNLAETKNMAFFSFQATKELASILGKQFDKEEIQQVCNALNSELLSFPENFMTGISQKQLCYFVNRFSKLYLTVFFDKARSDKWRKSIQVRLNLNEKTLNSASLNDNDVDTFYPKLKSFLEEHFKIELIRNEKK